MRRLPSSRLRGTSQNVSSFWVPLIPMCPWSTNLPLHTSRSLSPRWHLCWPSQSQHTDQRTELWPPSSPLPGATSNSSIPFRNESTALADSIKPFSRCGMFKHQPGNNSGMESPTNSLNLRWLSKTSFHPGRFKGPYPTVGGSLLSPIWLVPEGGLLLDTQMDVQPRSPE